MKRLALTLVILMLGILPAAAETVSKPPVRGAELDAMVREILEWITQNTKYAPGGSPDIVFVEEISTRVEKDSTSRTDGAPPKFIGVKIALYDPTAKRILLQHDWFGHTPSDWSTLAHELVHYAQVESGRRYRCHAEVELEATILSVEFINDRFDNQWANLVLELKSARANELLCAPPNPDADD
jgi:hypothetical protein